MRRFQKYLKGRLNKPSVSPSNGWLDRNKSALELFAIWIESVGVLVAALFAIQQYASNSAAEQVNKTSATLIDFIPKVWVMLANNLSGSLMSARMKFLGYPRIQNQRLSFPFI
ncbi:MAG: hypothetical protein EBQ73_10375 [Gammaproteobacteria bacterium]|nr:hypothetical protein [Gammaproteobacteria bacterium]